MKFKKINIEGFRGIRKGEIDDLSMVNIFLGQNNCGKTSLLEAIFLLSGYNNPNLVLNIDYFRNLVHTEEDDFSFIFFNLNYSFNLSLIAESYDKEIIKLDIIPKDRSGQTKVVTADSNTTSNLNENFKSTASPESTSRTAISQLDFKATVKGFQQQKTEYLSTIIGNKVGKEFELTSKVDPKKMKINIRALLQKSSPNITSQLPKMLQKLIIEKRKDELINNLKQLDKNIVDIISFNDNMIYVDIGAESLIPSNLMGDGFLKYLHTIINIDDVRGGVMLIDELDNGLHFKALKNLWRIILKVSRKNNTQLFITTHSKEALIYLKEVLEESDYTDFQNDVTCYTISKMQNSTLKAYKYDFESFEYAIENDIEIRGEI